MSQQQKYVDYLSQGSDPQIHWPETDALSGQFHPDSTMNDQYATSGHIVEGSEESEDVNYTPGMSGPALSTSNLDHERSRRVWWRHSASENYQGLVLHGPGS
jgi:hypothetical protein